MVYRYDPTSLTIVSLALAPDVHALPHIVEAVNDLLRPATIDSAVYNDLQRVVKVHGDSRAWTVKAMDGAAAQGRLDIMQWLRESRAEGCSAEACIAAATNGYLDVVKWLYELYPAVVQPVEAMTVAAKGGHAEIVRFLRTNVAMDDAMPALEDAAVNGRVEVVDALLPYYSGLAQGAFMVAAGNGQTEVVRLLLGLGFTSVMYINPSLREAAAGGYLELVGLLLPFCDDEALGDALYAAVAVNRIDILQLIVEKRHPKDIGSALEQAAVNNRRDMIQLLLDNCPEEDGSYLSQSSGDTDRSTRWHTQRSINTATVAAATRGYVATAKLLSKKSSEPAAGMALRIAVQTNDLELANIFVMKSTPVGRVDALVAAVAVENTDMVRTLIENGDLRMIEQALVKISSAGNHEMAATLLQRCDPASCQRVFENAAANGVIELVQQMMGQMSERTAGDALRLAAMNGHTGVVKVLLTKSDAAGVAAAFNVAAMQGRLAIVELLSERE